MSSIVPAFVSRHRQAFVGPPSGPLADAGFTTTCAPYRRSNSTVTNKYNTSSKEATVAAFIASAPPGEVGRRQPAFNLRHMTLVGES